MKFLLPIADRSRLLGSQNRCSIPSWPAITFRKKELQLLSNFSCDN